MSQAELPSTATVGRDHDDHDHPPFLAHHFDTPAQQHDSAKLGMWVFLGTELLMFGGLFCAYAVWRSNNYAAFEIGHVYLDTLWGAVNTVVLIASSFTMAWAVRAIQLGQQKLCLILLGLTFLGGVGFMCIKAYEYNTKFAHGLGPGRMYHAPQERAAELAALGAHAQTPSPAAVAGAPAGADAASAARTTLPAPGEAPPGLIPPQSADAPAAESDHGGHGGGAESAGGHHSHYVHSPEELLMARPFFSIYFLMTGLHGIHVLIGMGLIGWVMLRTSRAEFSSAYNTPVDLVGLYWHLVDLIWIFLFPLLYLIS